MRAVIYSFFLLIVSLCSCASDREQSTRDAQSQSIVFVNSIETILDENVPRWQEELNVPCVGIALIEDGTIRHTSIFGEHQLGKKAPQNTIFNVASVTKPVIATTVMKLVTEGRWDLDEPLYHYWIDPDIADDDRHRDITTRHVLSHRTGFKNWREGTLTFDFDPGTGYQYSGEGFEYLQKALEKKFEQPLDRIVDEVLFEPFGMHDASLIWQDNEDTTRFAHWFDGDGDKIEMSHKTYYPSAADNMLITIEDLATFGIEVMNGASISGELYDEMVHPYIAIHSNAEQGLGWVLVQDLPGGEYLLNHDGSDPGVAATIVLLPNSKQGIVVCTNGDNGWIIFHRAVQTVFNHGGLITDKLYWGRERPEIVELSDSALDSAAGTYLGGTFTFTKKGNGLVFSGGEGFPQLDLHPQSETTFFPLEVDLVFEFMRDTTGTVTAFKVFWNGKYLLSANKET